jgi:hypothetical protein
LHRLSILRRLPVAALLLVGVCSAGCSAAIDPIAIADAQTAVRVKTLIVNDPELGEHAITVSVTRGRVVLSGLVASAQQAERAVQLSRGVAGVQEVRSELRIGAAAVPAAVPESRAPQRQPVPLDDPQDVERGPLLLAVGAALGWSDPSAGAFLSRFTVSPLFKLGWGRGIGPAIGFGWFQADVDAAAQRESQSRVHLKPVMAGVGYTMASSRVSVSPSIVVGVSFNSLTITDTGAASGVPVEVDNSLAWRTGVSAWFDLGGRAALNVSTGYLMTGLRVTFLDGGRLVKRDARGDATLVHVGLAYRLF